MSARACWSGELTLGSADGCMVSLSTSETFAACDRPVQRQSEVFPSQSEVIALKGPPSMFDPDT